MADRPLRPMSHRCWAFLSMLTALGALGTWCQAANASEMRQTAVVRAVQNVRASVVNIRGEKTVSASGAPGQLDATRRVNGMGTGVVMDPRGYIITNHHVVDGVREIQVTLADRTRHTGRLVSRHPETDLAIIKIDTTESLQTMKIGTSSDLMVGESVIAVGNAYGYENTVTRGIVSALHRSVQVSDAQHYDDLIQTDASINPGNSGGPLLNIDGEMIGINVAVRQGAQGIGFAIPVDKVMAVAGELLATQAAQKNWTGLRLKAAEASNSQGAVVAEVEEKSPAEAAGLKTGDVITQVGGSKAERSLDFQRAMLDRGAGEAVELSVRRGEESVRVTLTTGKPQARPETVHGPVWDTLGLELKPISSEDFQQQYRTQYRGGLTITGVRPQSPAAEQGLHRGDVLVGLHVWETVAMEHVNYVLDRPDFTSFNPLRFIILRGKDSFYGYLPVGMVQSKRE
jgi:serine protease Do